MQPGFLPGFNASIDYYRIRIRDVISNLTARQEVDFCFAGLQQYCSAFDLAPPSGTPFVNVQAFNLASIYTNGFDIEASYRVRWHLRFGRWRRTSSTTSAIQAFPERCPCNRPV